MTPKKPAARRPSRRKAAPVLQQIELRSLPATGWSIEEMHEIGPQTAIRVTAILACVRFLAQSLASMPLHIMRTLPNGRREKADDLPVFPVLTKSPNGWMSGYELTELVIHHTALYGNSYCRLVPGDRGFCSSIEPLHPSRMTVTRLADKSLSYSYMRDNGARTVYSQDEILHVRWLSDNGYMGMVPAELCGTSIALARKLDAAASSYWDNAARPDVVLETQEAIPEQAVESLRRQWREMYGGPRNRGRTAVLPKKITAKTLQGDSQEASGFQELRNALVGEIARAFGVPSTLVGDSAMARWSNVEQEFLTAQVFCLLPWQRRLEGAIDRSILSTYDGVYAKLDGRGLLRGDTAARSQLYQAMWSMGAIRPNEIRDLEDLPLLDDPAADETYVQLGFSTLGAAAGSTTTVDPVVAATDGVQPDAVAAAAAGPTIQDTSLNGAQVTALLEIIAAVGGGTLDESSAVAVIVASFPQFDEAQAKKMVAGASAPPSPPGA
ncbi:MAG: phage portal protein [Planctomycetia bacterium]|nr:phage portal protein [Planctomycetia bacterium]